MAGRLEGKIALITGSTAGCGRACAIRFAAEGARVMVTGRNADAGREIVQAIREAEGEADFFAADMGVENEVAALVSATVERFGGIDILVNNAAPTELARGPDRADGSIVDLTTDQLDAMFKPALYGYLWACRFAVRHMIDQGRGGSIVNISSLTTTQPLPSMNSYVAVKGVTNSTSKAFAVEFAHHGIRVNNIVLGLIVTSDNMKKLTSDAVIGPQIRDRHLSRLGQPEDMANAALFLASDEAAFITGAELAVDGGMSVKNPLHSIFFRPS